MRPASNMRGCWCLPWYKPPTLLQGMTELSGRGGREREYILVGSHYSLHSTHLIIANIIREIRVILPDKGLALELSFLYYCRLSISLWEYVIFSERGLPRWKLVIFDIYISSFRHYSGFLNGIMSTDEYIGIVGTIHSLWFVILLLGKIWVTC